MKQFARYCCILIALLAPSVARAGQEPGPKLDDGTWQCKTPRTVRDIGAYFSLRWCVRGEGEQAEYSFLLYYDGGGRDELVLKGWGARLANGEAALDDAVVALCFEDGTWIQNAKGTGFNFSLAPPSHKRMVVSLSLVTEEGKTVVRIFTIKGGKLASNTGRSLS